MQRVEGVDVKAWLDENANELDSSGETEVIPFPRHREECDLTGLIRDVVRMRAPYENVCEACERDCLLYTSPSPRDGLLSRMPSSA